MQSLARVMVQMILMTLRPSVIIIILHEPVDVQLVADAVKDISEI